MHTLATILFQYKKGRDNEKANAFANKVFLEKIVYLSLLTLQILLGSFDNGPLLRALPLTLEGEMGTNRLGNVTEEASDESAIIKKF